MRIGYDLSERAAKGWGDPHGLRRIIAALGDRDEVDGVWLFAPFRMKEGMDGCAPEQAECGAAGQVWRHVAAHPLLALLPRVWRNLRMPVHLKRNGVDVYHAMTGEIPWRMARSSQRRVVNVDDVSFLVSPVAFGVWDRFAMRCRCYFSCSVAHCVITPDEGVRRALAAFGVERGKIVVMMPCLEQRAAEPPVGRERERVRRLYELPDSYLFMAGSIVASESYGEAVEALAEVVKGRRRDVGLVVCGRRTEYSDRLLEYADRMGIGGRVNIIYECDGCDAEVVRSMAAGQLILPQTERSVRPVVEAVAAGVPVIASDTEPLRAACGDAVLYVDPCSAERIADAMCVLLDGGDRVEALREAMRRRAAEFSPERAARRLVEIYESL